MDQRLCGVGLSLGEGAEKLWKVKRVRGEKGFFYLTYLFSLFYLSPFPLFAPILMLPGPPPPTLFSPPQGDGQGGGEFHYVGVGLAQMAGQELSQPQQEL